MIFRSYGINDTVTVRFLYKNKLSLEPDSWRIVNTCNVII